MFADKLLRRSLRDMDYLVNKMFEMPRMLEVPTLFRAPVSLRDVDRSPSVDVKENDSEFVIEAELPGVRKEDIRVQCFENRTISLDGSYSRRTKYSQPSPASQGEATVPADENTTEVTNKEESHSVLQSERAEGRFFRSFTFPEEIDCNKIDVTFENGLLSIVAPKTERKKGIPVTINVK